jgi:hypothetical protein
MVPRLAGKLGMVMALGRGIAGVLVHLDGQSKCLDIQNKR